MPPEFLRRLATACFIACAVAGCGGKRVTPIGPGNVIPMVRFTDAPASASERVSWSVNLRWSAYDPDGRVVSFRYAADAADPQVPDDTWITTERSEARMLLSASLVDSLLWTGAGGPEFHTVSLVALDDRGARSATASRSFFATTIAPTVQITVPDLNAPHATFGYLPPRMEIQFAGDDPDGVESRLPARYRWILLSDTTEVTMLTGLSYPDSIRRYYAPRRWAGWDSLPGNARRLRLPELAPHSEHMLVIVAIDAAGAYSPTMSRTSNMLRIRTAPADYYGPRFTVFNEDFSHEYPIGRYQPAEPADVIHYDVPVGIPTTIRWFAVPEAGARVDSYVVHFGDLNDAGVVLSADSLERSEPIRSLRSGPVASIDLGRLAIGFRQMLYIEAFDNYGARSLAMVDIRAVEATLDRPLLIVKDTRLPVDQVAPGGGLMRPSGPWPTQAELDTFLFARGGAPWRAYPAGTLSRPGLFAGYDFDTLGTRTGVPDLTVPLSTLLRYRRVIWISDRSAAMNPHGGDSPTAPKGALRYMSGRGRMNTLTQYVRAGGSVWLAGGGAAAATNIEYDKTNNNGRYGLTFSNANNELVPGRFMFDQARWQSEFRSVSAIAQVRKRTGRQPADHPVYSDPRLPTTLLPHSLAAGDTFPPNRAPINGDFYVSTFSLEYLSFMNDYREDVGGGPGSNRAALDTVYAANGATLPPPVENLVNACMTVYPSLDVAPEPMVIVSGFDLWSFQRVQCQAMVDFVLQRLWNVAPGPRIAVAGRAMGERLGPEARLQPNSPPRQGRVPASRPARKGRPTP